jgi:hypothetical protein
VTVTDNGGLTDTDSCEVRVDPPYPNAILSFTGMTLENHKITLSASNSRSPSRYPIDASKTRFTITAVSGCTAADIKYNGSLEGITTKDILVKKAGTIRVDLYVENTAGHSSTTFVFIDISPDLPPIADFEIPKFTIRDQVDASGNHYGLVTVYNISRCVDGDTIGHVRITFRYDSDNDGDFEDEIRKVLYDSNDNPSGSNTYYTDRPSVILYNSTNNSATMAYPSALTGPGHTVGKTMFDIEVEELLDNTNSIPEFITVDDVKKDNSFNW